MIVVKPQVTRKMMSHLTERVHRISRSSGNRRVWDNIQKPLQSALEVIEEKVNPCAIYRLFPVLDLDEECVVTQAGTIKSTMLSSLVGRCHGNRHMVFMMATLGPEFENSVDSNHDILSQWVYDLVGSELTEMVADEVELRVSKDLANQQLQVARRFSPGYCDWPLEGQDTIFSGLDAEAINVKLTPQKMMMPRKSISCVLASAENVPVKTQCLMCSKQECPFRRRHDE